MQELYFRKYLIELEAFKKENIIDTYKYLTDPDSIFRNNMMLFSIRYPEYKDIINNFNINMPK